jgi:hypothetical protein
MGGQIWTVRGMAILGALLGRGREQHVSHSSRQPRRLVPTSMSRNADLRQASPSGGTRASRGAGRETQKEPHHPLRAVGLSRAVRLLVTSPLFGEEASNLSVNEKESSNARGNPEAFGDYPFDAHCSGYNLKTCLEFFIWQRKKTSSRVRFFSVRSPR